MPVPKSISRHRPAGYQLGGHEGQQLPAGATTLPASRQHLLTRIYAAKLCWSETQQEQIFPAIGRASQLVTFVHRLAAVGW